MQKRGVYVPVRYKLYLFLQAFLMIADDIRKLANHEDYRSVISIKISRFYLSCLSH